MKDKSVLLQLIYDQGIKGSVRSLASALLEYANEMSDQGLKDKAKEAAEVSDILGDVDGILEDDEVDYDDEDYDHDTDE